MGSLPRVQNPEVQVLTNSLIGLLMIVIIIFLVLEDWTELPLVIPEQIKTARQIKYIFSGFLDKKVVSNP